MKRRRIIRVLVGAALVTACASLVQGQVSPGPRTGGLMAYDEARRHVVMFGGRGTPGTAEAYPNDLWAWDGKVWRELVPADSVRPPGRDVPHLAYDAARRRVVMFGGRRESADESVRLLSDVWEWDGTRWIEVRNAGAEPLLHAVAAYDPARKRVVAYGGITNAGMSRALRDWDGKTWTTRDANGPLTSIAGTISTTPRGEIIVVGLTPTADSDPVPPPAARTHVWLADAWRGAEVGPPMANLQPAAAAPNGTVYVYQAWERWVTEPITHVRSPDGTWTRVATTTNPGVRMTIAAAYDPVRGRFVIYGGKDRSQAMLGDTWEFDGRAWERRQ